MDTARIQNEVATKIAAYNDMCRLNVMNYLTTRGVLSLDAVVIADIYTAVRDFKDFTKDNDPYGEHDFGSITVDGHKVFWKIDYYDQQLQYGSEPLDPNCRRILTVMLAEEY